MSATSCVPVPPDDCLKVHRSVGFDQASYNTLIIEGLSVGNRDVGWLDGSLRAELESEDVARIYARR
jgi:hypothetical protein